ncbi:MAG: hypothetical protein WDN28_06780 [Chthoniobacter sp.]
MAPAALDVPISSRRTQPLYSVPERLISPSLDGGESFFDWLGAGSYSPGSEQGAMYRGERLIQRIRFGNNEETFFIRVDLRKRVVAELIVQFHQPIERRVSIALGEAKGTFVQVGVPLAELGVKGDGSLAFQVKVIQHGIELECYPESAPIQFALVGPDFALRNWIV